jgi:hypothetical protein
MSSIALTTLKTTITQNLKNFKSNYQSRISNRKAIREFTTSLEKYDEKCKKLDGRIKRLENKYPQEALAICQAYNNILLQDAQVIYTQYVHSDVQALVAKKSKSISTKLLKPGLVAIWVSAGLMTVSSVYACFIPTSAPIAPYVGVTLATSFVTFFGLFMGGMVATIRDANARIKRGILSIWNSIVSQVKDNVPALPRPESNRAE